MDSGCTPLLVGAFSNLKLLPTPSFLGVVAASPRRHGCPFGWSRRVGGAAEGFKPVIIAESFWGPAPIQEPTESLLTSTKDTPMTQKIPKDLGARWQALLHQPRSWGGCKSFKGCVRGPEQRLYIYIIFL